jgi:hypothetical protein
LVEAKHADPRNSVSSDETKSKRLWYVPNELVRLYSVVDQEPPVDHSCNVQDRYHHAFGSEPSSIAAEPQEALSGTELTSSVFFPT